MGDKAMSARYQTSSQLKNAAKDKLTGKYGSAVLVTFLSSLISFAVSFLVSNIASMTETAVYAMTQQTAAVTVLSVVFFLLSLVISIVLGVFELGLSLFFLNAACGQPFSAADLFYGFQRQSNKALGVSAVFTLLNTVCLTPSQLFLELFLNTQNSAWSTGALISLGIGLTIYIPLSLSLSQTFYLMLDFPDRSARDSLKLSIRLMKGHKRRLFYIQMSFLPLILLCLLSFGIGFLWLMPYMYMTSTAFFLDLMSSPEKTEKFPTAP